MQAAPKKIGDLAEVATVETVVRLDGPGGQLAELVPTGDVKSALAYLLEAAKGAGGRAFFVVGPFGSGKSHLLAAAGELLAGASRAPASWPDDIARSTAGLRRSLPLKVPLVDYRAELALEDVVRARARRCLDAAPAGGSDRREHWDLFLESAKSAGYQGITILLDELSEWLRAKRGPALTEDLRFLQFLGEWAKDRPAIVLAALQESIEEVANVSEKELARIRDRYNDLRLTMRHVEDLVRGRLVRLLPGAEAIVEKIGKETAASFPGAHFDRARLLRCYPLHPATLDLLEGLRFLLSQNRGVVDFVYRQVSADLGAEASTLITPERIWDHFQERLSERWETARLAAAVVPYWERAAGEIFGPADAALALRAVKLLCLLSVSPLERPRSAAELACMLLTKFSATDPSANAKYLEDVVLAPLVARGAYVTALAGQPVTYSVEAGADAAVALEARLQAARAELSEADRRMVSTLIELGSTPQLPLTLMKSAGLAKRQVIWQNTERYVTVGLSRVAEWSPEDAAKAVEAARGAGAETALVVAEPELLDAAEVADRARSLTGGAGTSPQHLAIWVPAALTEAELAYLSDIHTRRTVLAQVTKEGRTDLAELLERGRDAEAARAREVLSRIYFSGSLVPAGEGAGVDLPSLAGRSFDSQLPHLIGPALTRLHPLHARVAPRSELRGDRQVQVLVNEFVAVGHAGAAALERGGLRGLIENYLVPLGVARVRRDGAVLAPDPARSPAVAEVLRLVGEGGTVDGPWLLRSLAEGPLGLIDKEAILLLNACVCAGLIERWRGKRKPDETFLAVTSTDNFGPGELVEQPLREAVAALSPVTGPGPFEPWTSSTQREAWERAQAWLAERREDAAQVRSGLKRLDDFPALAAARTTQAEEDLRLVEAVVEACSGASSPAEGLRALVAAAGGAVAGDPNASGDGVFSAAGGGAGGLQAAARRLAALARFFRDELRRINDAASYVTHPELVVPEGSDGGLTGLRSAVLALVPQVLSLAAEDRLRELTSAIAEFRSAYVAAYVAAHDRHYSAVSQKEVEQLRSSPAYRALAALSGAIAAPDGRVKVDRMISAAVPPPCTRRVEQELSWKPRCPCGFRLGEPVPNLDTAKVLEVAERGARQHLAELRAPRARERVEEAAGQLEALGRAELAGDVRRLVELATEPDKADLMAVASVAGTEVQEVLRDVLAGGQLIVARDLAVLREDLIGRRYTKRRLLELFQAWLDPDGSLPGGGLVEVTDSSEGAPAGPGAGVGSAASASWGGSQNGRGLGVTGSPTVAFLRERFPGVAAVLPSEPAADAFWLAAWWAGGPEPIEPRRQGPPAWVPRALLETPRLAQAVSALRSGPDALAELADLDSRCSPGTALGEHIRRALGLEQATMAEVASVLSSERLLRYPLALAADQLVRRLAGDWQAAGDLFDLEALASAHYLVTSGELASLGHLLEASRHLGEIERRLAGASCCELVEDLYPEHLSEVPLLLSRASLAGAGRSLLPPEATEEFHASARRLLAAADRAFTRHAEAGFAGCLLVQDVGRAVLEPLLRGTGRAKEPSAEPNGAPGEAGKVAVVLVDAMRADAAKLVAGELARALPGRRLRWHWAVVPEPTRTAESVAAMALGRAVPAGAVPAGSRDVGGTAGQSPGAGGDWGPAPARNRGVGEPAGQGDRAEAHQPVLTPFEHLGYEVALLKRADRDHNAAQLRQLWSSPSPITVAVASSLDERLHHSSVELAVLLDDAVRTISQRVLASLSALPRSVPVVVMADHGFRESTAWGKGPEGRYTHGGTSLEECVVPVIVAT